MNRIKPNGRPAVCRKASCLVSWDGLIILTAPRQVQMKITVDLPVRLETRKTPSAQIAAIRIQAITSCSVRLALRYTSSSVVMPLSTL